jgi:hypothetical protein
VHKNLICGNFVIRLPDICQHGGVADRRAKSLADKQIYKVNNQEGNLKKRLISGNLRLKKVFINAGSMNNSTGNTLGNFCSH